MDTKNKKKVFDSRSEINDYIEQNEKALRKLYFDDDLTVKQICNLFNFYYEDQWSKAFHRILGPKGKGHGGARR